MTHQWSYVVLDGTWAPGEQNNGGFRIAWGCEIGFGELTVYLDKEGALRCDNEYMSDDFCQQVLAELYRRSQT